MLKQYKRNFILSNLLMVGVVLFAVEVIIFGYFFHAGTEELKTTMSQKLEPYDAIRDVLRQHPQAFFSPAPAPTGTESGSMPDADHRPPAPKEMPPKEEEDFEKPYAKSIFVFFYNTQSKETTVISRDADVVDEEVLSRIGEEVQNESENFGTLRGRDLYYFKQGSEDMKIAIAEKNFIRYQMLELFLVLAAIFIGAMLIFYLISRHLAAVAVRPLEESIQREKQFITDISHDLKTPLTAILANNDILSKNQTATVSEMQQWICGTGQAAENMRGLIEEMLVLSRSENTESREEMQKINLSDVIEQNALVMESVAYEKNISYETEIAPDIFVYANPGDINRVVYSLIDNALKYEAAGGSVLIALSRKGNRAVFRVANRSTVITKEEAAHIFERFYRLDQARQTNTGHGLGLAITKNLVGKMHGKIEVSGDSKEGTVFTVTLMTDTQKK